MAEEWDNLVTQARAIEGFEDFLAPTPFDRLRPAADAGPVVLVNTSSYRCDALILTPATSGADPVQVVELPDLTLELSIERAAALLAALYSRVGVRRALTAITGWLWDTVAGPVLNHLGHTGTPGPGEPWPRMWWCPTGPLTLLPLHAAGHHNDREACVPDRVVSSYTPTMTALIRARARPAPIHRPRLLAVGMPETPGHTPLPGVTVELDRIHTQIPITTRLQQPQTQVTIQAVLAALPEHEWVHFACHAGPAAAPSSDIAPDPSQSAIRLQDGQLTVQRIAECNLPAADLAYLSACQTAFGGTQLLDEAIHLAAALQLIGYRHVIATLWSISDQQAPNIAEAIYTHLTHPGTPSPDRAAQALHQALSTLRRQHPDTIIEWAAYLHTGP
jgi:CHAT domain